MLQNRGVRRLFFGKLLKTGAPSAQFSKVLQIFLALGARTIQKIIFTVLFVTFFHALAENVPPALKTVPALLDLADVAFPVIAFACVSVQSTEQRLCHEAETTPEINCILFVICEMLE